MPFVPPHGLKGSWAFEAWVLYELRLVKAGGGLETTWVVEMRFVEVLWVFYALNEVY